MSGLVIITGILLTVLLIASFVLYQQNWRETRTLQPDGVEVECHVELDPYRNNAEFVITFGETPIELRAERASGFTSKLRGFLGGGYEKTLDNGELWYFIADSKTETRLRNEFAWDALQDVLTEGGYLRISDGKLSYITSLSRYGRANNPSRDLLKETIRNLASMLETVENSGKTADEGI